MTSELRNASREEKRTRGLAACETCVCLLIDVSLYSIVFFSNTSVCVCGLLLLIVCVFVLKP